MKIPSHLRGGHEKKKLRNWKYWGLSLGLFGGLCIGYKWRFNRELGEDINKSFWYLNIKQLNPSHRVLLTNIQNLQNTFHTLPPITFLSAADNILSKIRELNPNIDTHQALRIQAAQFINQYYEVLDNVLLSAAVSSASPSSSSSSSLSSSSSFKSEPYHLDYFTFQAINNRKKKDMLLAFDLLDFSSSSSAKLPSDVNKLTRIHKMKYARQSHNALRIHEAYQNLLLPIQTTWKYQKLDEIKDNNNNNNNNTLQNKSNINQNNLSETKNLQEIFDQKPGETNTALLQNLGVIDPEVIDIIQQDKEIVNSIMIEPEVIAIFNNSPYVGDWKRFEMLGNELNSQDYSNTNLITMAHTDGVNVSDLLEIVKKFKVAEEIPMPNESELLFYARNITGIRVKYRDCNIISPIPTESNNTGLFQWLSSSSNENSEWKKLHTSWQEFNRKQQQQSEWRTLYQRVIEPKTEYQISGNSYNSESNMKESEESSQTHRTIPPRLCVYGGVQKCFSLTGCVTSVQGPVYPGNSHLRMRGSVIFNVPQLFQSNINEIAHKETLKDINEEIGERIRNWVMPGNMPLIAMNKFSKIKQTEEWDLHKEDDPEGLKNIWKGTIRVIREPLDHSNNNNSNNNNNNNNFQIEMVFDCEIELHRGRDEL